MFGIRVNFTEVPIPPCCGSFSWIEGHLNYVFSGPPLDSACIGRLLVTTCLFRPVVMLLKLQTKITYKIGLRSALILRLLLSYINFNGYRFRYLLDNWHKQLGYDENHNTSKIAIFFNAQGQNSKPTTHRYGFLIKMLDRGIWHATDVIGRNSIYGTQFGFVAMHWHSRCRI